MAKSVAARVLIADDSPETALMLTRILGDAGYSVVGHAEDGEACLKLVGETKPGLVLLDIMMPKLHGIDVLRRLKDDPATAGVGVVMCSARSFPADVQRATELGAFGFLTKPFRRQQVVDLVGAYFAKGSAAGGALGAGVGASSGGVESDPATGPGGEVYIPTVDMSRPMLRLWGTRGSIPVPGRATARHGGNTACMEVRAGDQVVVFDAGTGIRDLGAELLKDKPRTVPILIGHTHWDHIQGFPFFAPAYMRGYELDIYGGSGFRKDLRSIFQGQLDRDYFPVEIGDMAATMRFHHLRENPVQFGPIAVHWGFANHPGATLCFRIEVAGRRIGYLTDNEFLQGYLGRPDGVEPGSPLLTPHLEQIEFFRGVDLLIAEAQYFNEEYPKKIGWGHTSVSNACLLAKLVGAKRWIVTHHDPLQDDESLHRKHLLINQVLREIGHPIPVEMAYDGMTELL